MFIYIFELFIFKTLIKLNVYFTTENHKNVILIVNFYFIHITKIIS